MVVRFCPVRKPVRLSPKNDFKLISDVLYFQKKGVGLIIIFIKLSSGMKPHNYIYFNTKVCIYKAWIFHSPKLLVTSSDYHPNGESCSRTTTSFVLLHVCALKMCAMYYACSLYQVQYGSRKMGKKVQKKTQKRLKDNFKNLKIVRWPRQAGMWHSYKKNSSNKKILYWKKKLL